MPVQQNFPKPIANEQTIAMKYHEILCEQYNKSVVAKMNGVIQTINYKRMTIKDLTATMTKNLTLQQILTIANNNDEIKKDIKQKFDHI